MRKQYTVREFNEILKKFGYEWVSSKGDHNKWKKLGCTDVVIPAGHKEINMMMGRRLMNQILTENGVTV